MHHLHRTSCVSGRVGAAFGRPHAVRTRGFSVVEATIVIGIIAILAGVVLLAMKHVRGQGDSVAEQATVSALQKAVEQFKQENGFLPPLVVDTGPGAPILPSDNPLIWTAQDLADPNTTLNGSTAGDRRCYSLLSLPYYLIGALDTRYDGGAGLTFTAPKRDGSFSRHGRAHEAMVELTQQKTRLGSPRLYIANVTSAQPNQKIDCRIRDRWSDGTPGPVSGNTDAKEIRYYRWLNAFYPANDPKAGQVQYWNIPVEIGGNANNTLPPTNAVLRTAEYAIISAGPDHIFGTKDDIMEVGR